jgi:transcriptional antiterminator RfaH
MENLALENLCNQGYKCYLPMMKIEKVVNRKIEIKKVPLFPRYLFINLDFESKSWAPIRSTKGVSNLVRFGQIPAKIHDEIFQYLYSREHIFISKAQSLYQQGEGVKITNGLFSGFDSIYQSMDSEMRVLVLLEFMKRPLLMKLELNQVKLLT